MVGSGIQLVTLETESVIRNASKLLYMVTDRLPRHSSPSSMIR
jgi:hypothetical protein